MAKVKAVKVKRENPKKYNINTPKVKQYILHYGTPESLRAEDEKTDTAYAAKYKIKSLRTLNDYQKIEGFTAAAAAARQRWRNYYIRIADEAIEKRAKGMLLKSVGYDKDGNVSFRTAQELPPSEKAAELLYRVFGDINEREAKANAQAIIEAAAELDKADAAKDKK